jgi:hypothetical protein
LQMAIAILVTAPGICRNAAAPLLQAARVLA